MKPVIHYLWVGQPTEKNTTTAIAGHDIAGPIEMVRELKRQAGEKEKTNPIKFWCLEEYASFYQERFKAEAVDIEVCPIERLLREESRGHLATRAEKLLEYKASHLNIDDIQSKVMFKDAFSLFLLASQGGYFFDTNVFPQKDKIISLPENPTVTTARSPDGCNDFFMMYSPERGNPQMLKAFDRWITTPRHANLGVFDRLSIPYFDFRKEMGVEKQSYKTYMKTRGKGLFFWVKKDYEDLAKNLQYGEINEQCPYDLSIRAVRDFSLCYLKPPVKAEALASIPLTTNEAFVSDASIGTEGNIYYINKEKKIAKLIFSGQSFLFDHFPYSEKEPIYLSRQDTILEVLDYLGNYNRQEKDWHPEYIINLENCTLLHDAVLRRQAKHVQLLIDSGARSDLVATYEIRPSGEILRVTPRELAEFLNFEEIISLIPLSEKEKPDHAIEIQAGHSHSAQPSLTGEQGNTTGKTVTEARSNFTEEQIEEIGALIIKLDKEIKSIWPYPNKERKEKKLQGLNALLEKSCSMEVMTAIKEVEKAFPEMREGVISTRTADLLDNLKNQTCSLSFN